MVLSRQTQRSECQEQVKHPLIIRMMLTVPVRDSVEFGRSSLEELICFSIVVNSLAVLPATAADSTSCIRRQVLTRETCLLWEEKEACSVVVCSHQS